jgi:hypothetical protein
VTVVCLVGASACAQGASATSTGDSGTPDVTATTDGRARDAKPDGKKGRPDVTSITVDSGSDSGSQDGTTTDGPTDVVAADGAVAIGGACTGSNCAPPGECATIGSAQYCTEPCPATGCPGNTYCSNIGGADVCVPNLGQECLSCTTAANCKLPSDACFTASDGKGFCAIDCSVDGTCPNGYVCETMAEYASSAADGGGDAGATSGDAGGIPRWCVPPGNGGCCTAANAGLSETCVVTNENGTCTSQALCNGTTGMWVGCITPNGNLMAGCTCPSSGPAAGTACAAATSLGTVSDATGSMPITVSGRLDSATAVAVYTFQTTDTVNVTTGTSDSYHVSISFTEPAMNSEFVMDVIRGSTCSDTPTGMGTSITSYDWCVNGSSGMLGSDPCGSMAGTHCTNESSAYYVRVHRAAGATATCDEFQLTITAAGGACDFTMQCAPPPDAG